MSNVESIIEKICTTIINAILLAVAFTIIIGLLAQGMWVITVFAKKIFCLLLI